MDPKNPGKDAALRRFSLMVMDYLHAGQIPDLVADGPELQAPGHIAEIQEKLLVHEADFFRGFSSYHDAGAQDPIHRPGEVVVKIFHQRSEEHTSELQSQS